MREAQSEREGIAGCMHARNVYVIMAVGSLTLMGFAVPTKIRAYRELKSTNARIVELQGAILDCQKDIQYSQGRIKLEQQAIEKLSGK